MRKVRLKLETEQVIKHTFDIDIEVDDSLDIDDLTTYAYDDPSDIHGNKIYDLISDHAYNMVYDEKSEIISEELKTPSVKEVTVLSTQYITLRDITVFNDGNPCEIKKDDLVTLVGYDEEDDPIFTTQDGFRFYLFGETIHSIFQPLANYTVKNPIREENK